MARDYESWGRYPKDRQRAVPLRWRCDRLPLEGLGAQSVLPFGNGRSYGDSCLNTGGVLLDARPLSRFIHFDPQQGILACEAGVLLSEILALVVPRGWFLAVTPGTQYVTVGGALANDVHGKNHHRAGTFGCHVRRFELLRSDGTRLLCSPDQNADWFAATIGGLGLTGLITWAEIELKPIPSPCVAQETIPFSSLDEFFAISSDSDERFEYTVAWVDCLARGREVGRGIFFRGNHATAEVGEIPSAPRLRRSIPVVPPVSLMNHWTLAVFNRLYYQTQRLRQNRSISHYQPFFYPLDSVACWNRIYGRNGFVQYQCVVPPEQGTQAMREILDRIARAGTGSFLAVLKAFGCRRSPGMLSFPRPGVTLALDFPNHGGKTLSLLDQLDEVTSSAGGAVSPAKDARMKPRHFEQYFPRWRDMERYLDPRFSSSFWRRVRGAAPCAGC